MTKAKHIEPLQLIDLAEKYKQHPGVSVLLLTLKKHQPKARHHLANLDLLRQAMADALDGERGRRVPLDTSDLVEQSAKAHASLTLVSHALLDLATVLQELGEPIEY